MNHSPCPLLRTRKRLPLRLVAAASSVAALLCLAPAALADDDGRGLGQAGPGAPLRHVLVKAVGQGVTAEEADQDALRNARLVAAKHYAALGGAAALDASPQGVRVIALHHSPPMALASLRAVALVEARLRPMPEPPPAALGLPVLTVNVEAAQIQVEASRPCEILVALDPADGGEPELLPGGGGAAYRLAPGKPMRQSLPLSGAASLRVLACTGGINVPAAASTLEESLAKARSGKPRPTIMQGVVSECVEVQAARPAPAGVIKRSMRQKGSELPVNITGAAGREGGLPVAKETP